MKFSIKEKPIVTAPKPEPMTAAQVSAAYEGLLVAYMELSDAQRNLDEVCQAMSNIDISMKMIKTGGLDVIKMLNVDKSMEDLFGLAEDKITVKIAEEGFGQVTGELWTKFWEWIKRVAVAVRNFFASMFGFRKKKEEEVQEVASASDDIVIEAIGALFNVNSVARKENIALDRIRSDMEKLGEVITKAAIKEGDIERLSDEIDKLRNRTMKAANEWYAEMARFLDNHPKDANVITIVNELNNVFDDQFKLVETGIDVLRTKLSNVKEFNDLDQELEKMTKIIGGNESLSSAASIEGNSVTINMFSAAARTVKQRCASSKMKQYNEKADACDRTVVKFHADLEVGLSKLKDHPEVLRQIASQIRKIENFISQLSNLDVTILKQSTYVTSKIAKHIR